MSDTNPNQHELDPTTHPSIVLPSMQEQETDVNELQKEGLEVDVEENTPEEELGIDHPTPNRPSGRVL